MARMVKEGRGWVPRTAHAEGVRVARLLERWIEESGYTIHKVEEIVGWGQKTLWEVINGDQPIRFSHVKAVAEACGFPVENFYAALAGKAETPSLAGQDDRSPRQLTSREVLAVRRMLKRLKDAKGEVGNT